MSFLFNWLGFLVCICLTNTLAGRYGALAGFGLSMVKWVAIVKVSHSAVTNIQSFNPVFFPQLNFIWKTSLKTKILLITKFHFSITLKNAVTGIHNLLIKGFAYEKKYFCKTLLKTKILTSHWSEMIGVSNFASHLCHG